MQNVQVAIVERTGRKHRRGRAHARSILATLLALACTVLASPAQAEDSPQLPSPLDAATVVRIARARRAEIAAARARAAAASERPKIVAALPDPSVIVQADHIPYDFRHVGGSLTLQQEFPLSGVRGDRRRAAEAEADRWRADVSRATLDVELEALQAFFMLAERRGNAVILDDQIAILDQLVTIARAHYAAGQGMLADVLRLENEAARFRADRRALDSEIRGAEAMLDTTLARDPTAPIPELAWTDDESEPPAADGLVRKALAARPELVSARAGRRRALADIDAMHSMYAPMAVVRAGPAYNMIDGVGAMVMVGISIPLWRERLGAGVTEAQSMAAMANAEIVAMERMVAGNVIVARERVLAERTRLVAIRQDILPRAKLIVATATGSFAAGQGAMLAVFDSARDLRDIRMQEIMARARLSAAWARLRRETGG